MKKLFTILAFLLLSRVALGTTYYVRTDGSDANCNGTVNVADTVGVRPNCAERNITAAATNAAIAGDIVHIGAGTWNESVSAFSSGAAGNPIIFEGEGTLGANTIWRCTTCGLDSLAGAVSITDKSYIKFRTIKFDGTTAKGTWRSLANTVDVTGLEIDSCTFSNNGNRGIDLDHTTGAARTVIFDRVSPHNNYSHKVTNSVFTGNYGFAILLQSMNNGVFSFNTCTGQKSSQFSSADAYQYEAKFVQSGQGGSGNMFEGNNVHDFVKDAYIPASGGNCAGPGLSCQYTAVGFRGDTSASGNIYLRNTIYNIDASNAGNQGYGIYLEASNNSHVLKNNIIYNIGHDGIHFGSTAQAAAQNNTVDGNVLYNCACNGIRWSHATGGTQKNNIVYVVGSSPVAASDSDQTTGIVYKKNLYFHTAGTNINGWNTTSAAQCSPNVNAATWADSSHANETGMIAGSDPLFVSLATPDFHLLAGSPAKLQGDLGQDMGAYPDDNTPPPPNTITVVYPNGGEHLRADIDTANILWETVQGGTCTISLARDGTNFNEILSSTTNCTDQTFAWPVTPPARLSTAIFRVRSNSDGTVTDDSDGPNFIDGRWLK